MAAPLLGMAALNAIVFGVYGNLMKLFQRYSGRDTPGLHYSFFSGAVAGFSQVVICSPSELIKLRLQFQKNKLDLIPHTLHHRHTSDIHVYSGPWDACRKIYKQDGLFRGLGKGYWVTCTREIPAFSFYFFIYDLLCSSAIQHKGLSHVDQLSPAFICLAGGLGGIAAWVVSYPADVVKSRYQVDGMSAGGRGLRYRSATDCFVQSSREGWKVFTIGLLPTVLRAFPVNAVTFVTVALVLRSSRRRGSDLP